MSLIYPFILHTVSTVLVPFIALIPAADNTSINNTSIYNTSINNTSISESFWVFLKQFQHKIINNISLQAFTNTTTSIYCPYFPSIYYRYTAICLKTLDIYAHRYIAINIAILYYRGFQKNPAHNSCQYTWYRPITEWWEHTHIEMIDLINNTTINKPVISGRCEGLLTANY